MGRHSTFYSALPRCRLSHAALTRLESWGAKFGPPRAGNHPLGSGGVVRSPIPREKLQLISDKQWRYIIGKNWAQRQKSARKRDFLIEVSHEQFSHDFGVAARVDPERFISLALCVPPSAPRVYFRSLMSALSDKPSTTREGEVPDVIVAPVERIEEVLRHIQGFLKERYIAWAVCELVRNRSTESWSSWVIDLIIAYAKGHAEPRHGEPSEGEGPLSSTDIDTSIEESVRGTAVETLAALLFDNSDLAETMFPVIECLANDPNPEVRAAVQGLCIPALNVERKRAVQLFLQACAHSDDSVLTSFYTMRFLGYASDFDLTPLLARMIASGHEKVAEAGAFWAIVGQMRDGRYSELTEQFQASSKAHRKGMSRAMAQLLRLPGSKQQALDGLLDLITRSDESAAMEISHLLRDREVLASPEGPLLAEAYVRSSSWKEPKDLFFALSQFTGSLVPYATILLATVRRLGGLTLSTKDVSTRLSGATRYLTEVLLRLYEQAEAPNLADVRSVCLDAWDALLRDQAGLSWDLLLKLDS
jgi:hypothetical protein